MKEKFESGKEIVLLEVRKNKVTIQRKRKFWNCVCERERVCERECVISYKMQCKVAFRMKLRDLVRKGHV